MKPRITFRVNGTRIGDDARPTESPIEPAATRLPMKRAIAPRAALSTRPNEYMPDDDEVAS
ncbi:MAG: hypothetical protein M4D80_19945 [Myxococcota bacterium]|nr:hypothetical protein [Deltaproteobacteria bacterium]MDQ3337441.1 hypothetical protein [Myxococcota bacterium]